MRGVRRIRDGRLAEPLRDMPWRTSLLRTFACIAGIGSTIGRSLGGSGYLGGVAAPALAIKVPELATGQQPD